MATPETLCPKCGFSPIPDGVQTCPRCAEIFSFTPLYKVAQRNMLRKEDGLESEATLLGGLTGAVSANPGPPATVLALAALLWLVRGAGLLAQLPEPTWLFGFAAVELIAATMLMANVGPATLFAQAVALAQIGVSFVLTGEQPALHTWFSAVVGVTLFAMTAGEPGATRRYAGLAIGVLSLAATVVSLYS